MAQLLNPTSGSVVVPLLIEDKHLLALDKVFEDFVIETKCQDACQRSVIIYLSAGRTVKANTFAEAMKQPHVITEEPVGFRAHLEGADIQASVTLTKLAQNIVQPISPTQFQVVQQSPRLDFNVEPSEKRAAQEFFGALQNWAADFAPSTRMRIWSRNRPLFAILFLCWLFIGLIFGLFDLKVPSDSYVEQAHKIVQRGVDDTNQHKAIELILAIASHDPEVSKSLFPSKPDRRYWAVFVGVALVFLSLTFCPSVVIGIWRGKPKLERWRWWIKWIFVTVPSALILTVLLPKVLSLFGL